MRPRARDHEGELQRREGERHRRRRHTRKDVAEKLRVLGRIWVVRWAPKLPASLRWLSLSLSLWWWVASPEEAGGPALSVPAACCLSCPPAALSRSRALSPLSLLPFALVARCCSISLVVAISSPLSRSPSSRAFARGYLGCSREVSQERQSARVLASPKIDLSRATKRQLPREILAAPPPPTGRHRHTHTPSPWRRWCSTSLLQRGTRRPPARAMHMERSSSIGTTAIRRATVDLSIDRARLLGGGGGGDTRRWHARTHAYLLLHWRAAPRSIALTRTHARRSIRSRAVSLITREEEQAATFPVPHMSGSLSRALSRDISFARSLVRSCPAYQISLPQRRCCEESRRAERLLIRIDRLIVTFCVWLRGWCVPDLI